MGFVSLGDAALCTIIVCLADCLFLSSPPACAFAYERDGANWGVSSLPYSLFTSGLNLELPTDQ